MDTGATVNAAPMRVDSRRFEQAQPEPVALVPLNVVIVYWNFVLDEGAVEWTFGALSIAFNAILAWPWRRYFWPLFVWKGRADYTLSPLPPAS